MLRTTEHLTKKIADAKCIICEGFGYQKKYDSGYTGFHQPICTDCNGTGARFIWARRYDGHMSYQYSIANLSYIILNIIIHIIKERKKVLAVGYDDEGNWTISLIRASSEFYQSNDVFTVGDSEYINNSVPCGIIKEPENVALTILQAFIHLEGL